MTDVSSLSGRAFKMLRKSPTQFVRAITMRTLLRIQAWLMVPASRNGFLASLYFTFFSKRFYREHRAVLAGIVACRHADLVQLDSYGPFRRNVHRLEKALVMRPRRPSFAERYIGETVAQFVRACGSRIDAGELGWARDVLTEYFAVVKDTPQIAAARRRFEELDLPGTAGNAIPYPLAELQRSGIAFNDLRQLFLERRSTRWFEQRPVPADLIEKAIEAASLAPTACNRLPYRFDVLIDPARAAEVAHLAGGTAGYAENIPCLIVMVGDLSYYVEERDRHLIYIDGSLAAMQLMLAFETLGLSSVPINWPDVESREAGMAKLLGLAYQERPIMLIGVGYGDPDGMIPFSQKKPVSLLMKIHD